MPEETNQMMQSSLLRHIVTNLTIAQTRRWWIWNMPFSLTFKPFAKSRICLNFSLSVPLMINYCKDVQSFLSFYGVDEIKSSWKMDTQLLKKISI
jgi:hypothetical protein